MDAETQRYIDRRFAKLGRKMRNLMGRGVVDTVQDEHMMQTNQMKMLDGEMLEGAERAQQYGFSSTPQAGAEAFVVFANGDRDHPIILAVDDRRFRIKGSAAGEVVIYTDEGDTIHLKRNNTIEIKTKKFLIEAEEEVTVKTQTFNIEAASFNAGGASSAKTRSAGNMNFALTGGLTSSGDIVAGGVSQMTHVHENVQKGSDDTGEPKK